MPPKRSSGKNEKGKQTTVQLGQHRPSSQTPSSSQRQSQASMTLTQADRVASGIDRDELDQKVNDLVQYLLIMWQKNYPIKKLDINKSVLKEHKAAFSHIMKKAQDKLASVFGVDVIELQEKHKGCFVLINRLENDPCNPHLTWPAEEESRTGLLMIVLSLIFMNGNIMQDSKLWHALKTLGIEADIPHATFGDARKLITQEFVRQGYIEYIRQMNVDPPSYEFKWGQRSELETSKRNCLAFVSQIYGMEPKQWTSQYQDMEETDVQTHNNSET